MPFTHEIDACFQPGLLTRAAYDTVLARTAPALAGLKRAYEDFSLPLLRLPAERADLKAAVPVAKHLLNNTSDLVVFGIGGSSLGAQALAQLAFWGVPAELHKAGTPRFHFLDNLDGATLSRALGSFDLKTTRFLVVSKSGGTPETLLQTLIAIDALEKAGGGKYLKHHFAAIVEPGDSALRRLAAEIGCPVLDHPPGVGGRYSVLTAVGLLPALMLGLDAENVREGAAAVLQPILDGAAPDRVPAARGAALAVALAERKVTHSILWAYGDRLDRLAFWWRQLWAESLGKHGHGTTPVRAIGPLDQHSQLQLYLDGPEDKMFTFLLPPVAGEGPTVPVERARALGLDAFAGRTVGDVVDAQARATADTLIASGRPVRIMRLDAVDETTFGGLMMHFMLETILAARLWDVDPFDQPAVEQGKILTRQYLGQGR